MPIYTAKMKHSEATIIRLAETRYNTFQFGKKLIRLGLALVLIMIGLYLGGDNITPWICLFVGCVLITGLNTRPRSEGRKIFQQLNGKSLESQYSFFEDGFKFYDDGELIPYKKLIRLVEDKEYLYLYISQESAYMVDRSTVQPGDSNKLKDFLPGKTGMEWTKPFNLLTFRFRSILGGGKDKGFTGYRLK